MLLMPENIKCDGRALWNGELERGVQTQKHIDAQMFEKKYWMQNNQNKITCFIGNHFVFSFFLLLIDSIFWFFFPFFQ